MSGCGIQCHRLSAAAPKVAMGQSAVRAANHLLAAGMVVRYQSRWGNTIYLGWPGRKGVLRVSDHQSKAGREAGIYARITIPFSHTSSEDAIMDRCAVALGRYLMKTAGDGITEFICPNDPPITARPWWKRMATAVLQMRKGISPDDNGKAGHTEA